MKRIKLISIVISAVALILLSSCSAYQYPVQYGQETQVVLSQNNFTVLNTVEASVSQVYVLGIGGLSKKTLKQNAVLEMTKKANLTGSQALINVNVYSRIDMATIFYSRVTYIASGQVVEFK